MTARLSARVSEVELPAARPHPQPWPGAEVDGVFVRRTPWTGPDGPGTDGDAHERALYVHGLGGASTNWTDLAALLAVRVDGWALDLPGFGNSAPRARRSYSIRGHVRAVVDLLERIAAEPGTGQGRPVHLLGNSLGGLVSLLVAARRPDLVASLTLISPAMPVYRPPQAIGPALLLLLLPGMTTVAERRLAGISPERSVRNLVAMCFGDPSRIPPERLEQAVEEMRARARLTWANRALARTMRGLMLSYLRLGPANAWRAARRLRMPTLVIWGDRDRLVSPALAPRLAGAVPGARLLVLPGVGHVAMLEAPEETARVVLGLMEDARTEDGPA